MQTPTPRQTRTYHIFLASPGDMDAERQAVRDFIADYNRDTANHRGLEFKVIDWENHASTGVGRAQGLINSQTLEEYRGSLVLVVGLLGQRFGSPTGKAESGTEEEFELALKLHREQGWPEIKWFFREEWGAAGVPTSTKAMKAAAAQMAKVEKFQSRLEKEGDSKLLYGSFETTEDFPKLLTRDLTAWLNAAERPWNGPNTGPDPDPDPDPDTDLEADTDDWWQSYFDLLAEDCARLPLSLLKAEDYEVRLEDVFVPLDVVRPPRPRSDADDEPAEPVGLAEAMDRGEGDQREPVFETLARERKLVLVGAPGSGKSTLVNHLTQGLLAGNVLGDKLLGDARGPFAGLLPVRIVLRRVEVPEQGEADPAWLWQALEQDIADRLQTQILDQRHRQRVAAQLCRRINERAARPPGLLLMLDGLDEVSEAGERRARLLEAVQTLADGLPAHNRLLVTARPYAYAEGGRRLRGVPFAVLAPFDTEQLAAFLHNWHRLDRASRGLTEAEAEARADDLIARLERRPEVRRLAERPLHASLIALLNLRGNRLPEDRCQLFEEIVELLLLRWRAGESAFRDHQGQVMAVDEPALRACLADLAWRAHDAQRGGNAHTAADIPADLLRAAFDPLLDQHGRLDLVNYLRQHAGILIERDHDRFAFPHRAFQEYLAMLHLEAQDHDGLIDRAAADPLWWREVFRLAVARQRGAAHFGWASVQQLMEREADADTPATAWRINILAALALLELKPEHLDERRRGPIRRRLVALIEDPDALDPPERLEAGLALGAIGDPRCGVGLDAEGLPAIDWVEIVSEQGFVYQEDEALSLEPFHIARYPITNSQFQAFVEARDGHVNRAWWAGIEDESQQPGEPRWSDPNCPRERVSWYQALAFCRWLSARLGYRVSLPTEQQWERVARSTDGREYPWGEGYRSGYANVDETRGDSGEYYLGRTSPVGLYRSGRSEERVFDLSGNVWEWCLNKYDNPEVTEADGSGDGRVLRGGSWLYDSGFARATLRYDLHPDVRDYFIGFRVCCAAPIRATEP